MYTFFVLQTVAKDVPEWIKYSTVHPSGNLVPDSSSTPTHHLMAQSATHAAAAALPGIGHTGCMMYSDVVCEGVMLVLALIVKRLTASKNCRDDAIVC